MSFGILFFYSYVFDMCLYYEPSLVYQSKRERHVMISLNLGTFQIYIVPCRSSSIYVPAVNRNHTIYLPKNFGIFSGKNPQRVTLVHRPLSVCHHLSFSFLSATMPSRIFQRPVHPSLPPMRLSPASLSKSLTSIRPPFSSVVPRSGRRWYLIGLPAVPMNPAMEKVSVIVPSSSTTLTVNFGRERAASRRVWAAS